MSGRLKEKVCVITGAGSGIGKSTALLFAQEGACVVVADIDGAAADGTIREIKGAGGSASSAIVDVTDPAAARRLADAVAKDHGRIDVLFNNARISGVGTLHETPIELWDKVMAVNVRGVFLVTKYVVPYMLEKRRGSIINMSSTIADIGLA